MNKNKVLGLLSHLLFTALGLYILYRVVYYRFVDSESINFGVMNIWFGYALLCMMIQGLAIRPSHMSKVKLNCMFTDEIYEQETWKASDLKTAYYTPVIQDFIVRSSHGFVLSNVIESYEEEGEYATPTIYKIANFLLKICLNGFLSIIIMVAIFVLPKVTNDYDLYRGLTYEQVIMLSMGLGLALYNIVISIINKATYDCIDDVMQVPNSKFRSVALTTLLVVSVGIVVLLLLSVITGVLGIYIEVFQFLFNFELIGVYILLSPAFLLIHTAIMKNQFDRYNIYLNYELRDYY